LSSLVTTKYRHGKKKRSEYKIGHNNDKKETEKEFEMKEPGIIRDAEAIYRLTSLAFISLILALILSAIFLIIGQP